MLHPSEFAAVLAFASVVALIFLSAGVILIQMTLAWWRPGQFKPTGWRARRPVRIVILTLAGLGTLCIAYGWFVEPYWIETTHVEVQTADWPAGAHLRITLISDLHLDNEGPRERALPALIDATRPDVLLIAGDFLNTPDAGDALHRLALQFRAPHGVYAILGNGCLWGVDPRAALAGTPVTMLDPGEVDLEAAPGARCRIVGAPFAGDEAHVRAVAKADPESFTIALAHAPQAVEDVDTSRCDLFLCGHTHGGQIRLPLYGGLITLSRHGKKYEAGRYEVGPMTVYVTRGIGCEGGLLPRVRFLCRPEITVIDVVGTKAP